jgi:putative nucleotidyltransferase with HDIG domain
LSRIPAILLSRLCVLVDSETLAHSYRVARLGVSLGRELGLDDEALRNIYIGGVLHDIGKGTIPGEILCKPGSLLPEERARVEEHSAAGVRLLLETAPSIAAAVVDIVRHHHERLDGSGYPDRLEGTQISKATRVIAVADVYDALVSHRPYRRALSHAEAVAELDRAVKSGKLDARVVAALKRGAGAGRRFHRAVDVVPVI